ncbi:hypothetical protein CBR_g7936 [Chara braunii]|uniref:Uncharacterized protein n=1 Tax=Chara braunii TaxID=69332 RepID=A0A388KKQ9_CHABU|nr:hypothetical protein CBR_g7936 [Chara braunii]|eukprot:GBG70634.1 hypothetical protein CBR_g7936 [Chara braunii]
MRKDCDTTEGDNTAGNADNAKKRGQDKITGIPTGQPSTPRQRVNEVGALDAGLLLMNIDNVQRAQVHMNRMMERAQNQQNLMFERILGLIERIETSNRSAANPPLADHVQAASVALTGYSSTGAPIETAAGGSRTDPVRVRDVRTAPTVAPPPSGPRQPQLPVVPQQPHCPTVVIPDELVSDQPISPPAARSPTPPHPPIPPGHTSRSNLHTSPRPAPPHVPSGRRAPGIVIRDQAPRTANRLVTRSMATPADEQTQDNPARLSTSPGFGFDRVRERSKAVVANPDPGGRRQYREEMEKVLMAKYKNELVELCNKDKVKYHNKKQAVADLTTIRVRDVYGEEEEEEKEHVNGMTEETQEENPS